jgi:hypothetical protein
MCGGGCLKTYSAITFITQPNNHTDQKSIGEEQASHQRSHKNIKSIIILFSDEYMAVGAAVRSDKMSAI